MAPLSSIEQLPLEVLECIEVYLSDKDLFRCCTVCKSWREVFSDDMLWKKRCNIILSDYLESAACLVEPHFNIPCVENCSLTPISGWRLCFLREQHYLKNFRSGRYERKEIEFDFDDSIDYNIKVEFVGNDYVFLHTTFETQVWDVAQEPNLFMSIPFQLVELWEANFYQFHQNKLVVVQCNVVQMFNVCLLSKTLSFHRTFFFDKPEEFSLNISKETDVNEIFKSTSHEIGDSVERVICGDYLIGIVTTKTSMQNPVMHIWDLNSGKKLKEENSSEQFGSGIRLFEISSSSQDKIVVHCQKNQENHFHVYCLAEFRFLTSYKSYCLISTSMMCGTYLYICEHPNNKFLRYNLVTHVLESVYKLNFNTGNFSDWDWDIICDKIVVLKKGDLTLINPFTKAKEIQKEISSRPGVVKVVNDKYLVLSTDLKSSMRVELFEYREASSSTNNEQSSFIKLFSLPEDSGIYRTTNVVCTKLLLERANKLIVLNFW